MNAKGNQAVFIRENKLFHGVLVDLFADFDQNLYSDQISGFVPHINFRRAISLRINIVKYLVGAEDMTETAFLVVNCCRVVIV